MDVCQNANEIIIGDGSVNNFYDYFSLHFSLYPKFLQQACSYSENKCYEKKYSTLSVPYSASLFPSSHLAKMSVSPLHVIRDTFAPLHEVDFS